MIGKAKQPIWWLMRIKCWFAGHWWAECPDGSGELFCERGCLADYKGGQLRHDKNKGK